jgi:hypothetical protein
VGATCGVLAKLRKLPVNGIRSTCWCLALALSATCNRGLSAGGQIPTFGTTVVESAGFRGNIYLIPSNAIALPNLKHLNPVGTIYTTRLNVPPRDFREGFPGITGRIEWFAIDYHGRFFVPSRGRYQFGLISDDGSKLYVDDRRIIDNDGIHPPSGCQANLELEVGTHSIQVLYMQGPGLFVALQLFIAKAREPWRVFDTRDYIPPENTSETLGKKGVRKLSEGYCRGGQ